MWFIVFSSRGRREPLARGEKMPGAFVKVFKFRLNFPELF